MGSLVHLYKFIANPVHQTDALLFLALEVFLPVLLVALALWTKRDRLAAGRL